MRRIALSILMAALLQMNIFAQKNFVKHSSDILCLAPSATALIKAIAEDDKKGVIQLGLSSATGIAINYALNACIAKERPDMPVTPDWGDRHAFPSTHTMAAFDGATFLMKRYGWKWGVPAYVVSTYVAWGRTYTKHHDCWDVLAGAAIGAGSAMIFTKTFTKDLDISISPVLLKEDTAGMYFSLRF